MSDKQKGGKREGAGPKPKYSEPMRMRSMRWTDSAWADVLFIGTDKVRELVQKEAEKQRKALASE